MKIALRAVFLIFLLFLLAAVVFLRMGSPVPEDSPLELLKPEPKIIPKPESFLNEYTAHLFSREASTELGARLCDLAADINQASLSGEFEPAETTATQELELVCVDMNALTERMKETMNAILAQRVEAAYLSSEIYDEELHYRPEVLDQALEEAMEQTLQKMDSFSVTQTVALNFVLKEDSWQLSNGDEVEALLSQVYPEDMDAFAQELPGTVAGAAQYVQKIYTIEEGSLTGQKPNPALYGSTADPADIEALLQTPLARQLVGDQELAWNAEIELLARSEIEYYLDESILVLVWKEDVEKNWGTFAEIFIADGSQLRRRIAGDTYKDMHFEQATSFGAKSNAVLTFGGDMYNHSRDCGVMVYDRVIYRFKPSMTDTCFITADGDMLFSYRGEMETEEEAQAYVEENDVIFSLVFGPVLIDNGEDVTPERYAWGEINQKYARAALGMLGEHHYLTMNINNYVSANYHVCTLRVAADAMMAKGCVKAYALDGGQTAVTVFNGRYLNPVQFSYQRNVSDVIYFATAVPSVWETEAEETAA